MRILVVSDTHGEFTKFDRAVLSQSSAEVIFHLGDGHEQADKVKTLYSDKMVVSVKGNCDWYSNKKDVEIIQLEGKKIMAAHGHLYDVKRGTRRIIDAAKANGVDILLYGHTHMPATFYEDGMYIMNPGSLRGADATCGFIDITPNGIATQICRIK